MSMPFQNNASSNVVYLEEARHDTNTSHLEWLPDSFINDASFFWENEALLIPKRHLAAPVIHVREAPSASSSLSDSSNTGDTTNSWFATRDNLTSAQLMHGAWELLSPESYELHDQCHETEPQVVQTQHVSTTEVAKVTQQKYVCKVPGCVARSGATPSFGDIAGLKRHTRKHDPNANRWICGDCRKETRRKDHILDHLRKIHKLPRDALPLPCESCSSPRDGRRHSRKEMLFSTRASLDEHIRDDHAEVPVFQKDKLTSDFDFPTAFETAQNFSLGTPSIPTSSDHSSAVSPVPTSSQAPQVAKHLLRPEGKLRAKRGKFGHSKEDMAHAPGDGLIVTASNDNSRGIFAGPVVNLNSDQQNSDEILGVRIMDVLLLFKLHSFLQALDCSDAPLISFNISKGSLEIRGVSSRLKVTKDILEDGLKEVRRLFATGNRPSNQNQKGVAVKTSARLKSSMLPCSRSSSATKMIFAVQAKEDSDISSFWTNHILPVLSTILRPLLGENYSAALVRQGSSLESSIPVIRISSTLGQSVSIRNKIIHKIHAICGEHRERNIPVSFSIGTIEQIARTEVEFDMDEDQANDESTFPHQKRDWRQPGMGASIGYNGTSATLGGYVLIDQQIYMLTVDHLFEKGSQGVTTNVTSPSLSDVKAVIEDLEQTFRDIEAQCGEYFHELNHPSGSIPLDNTLGHNPGFMDLVNTVDRWRGYYRELIRDEKEFDLGQVYRRSGLLESVTSGLPSADQNPLPCRMNWCVVEVLKNRLGENRHRHKFCPEKGTVDVLSENQYPKGAGPLCQETCDVRGSEQVHFVGERSGRQTGQISAARRLITCDGTSYSEWVIVPDNPRGYADYHGDSGAWVIRTSDNALAGLLWCWCDGHLVFTSIREVFASIRQTLNANEISLPKAMRPHSDSDAPAPASVSWGISIAREQEKVPRAPRNLLGNRWRDFARLAKATPLRPDVDLRSLKSNANPEPTDITSPKELLSGPKEPESVVQLLIDKNKVTNTADTTPSASDSVSTRSLTPVPSLSHSGSSSSDSPEMSLRSLPTSKLASQLDYILDSSSVTIAEEEDASVQDITQVREERLLKCLPERTLRKSQNGNKLALGYILDDASLTDDHFPTINKLSMGKAEPWQLIETWRTGIEGEVG